MIARAAKHLTPRRALIVKPSALGDVVTALPVLRALKRTFPDVHTAWLLSDTCAPLVSHDPQLDDVVLFERRRLGRCWRSISAAKALRRLLKTLKKSKYDWVIDLQGLLRSGLLSAATKAPLRAGFADAREGASWFYDPGVDVTAIHTVDRNIALARAIGLDARPDDMTLTVAPEAVAFVERLRRDHDLPDGPYLVCVPPTRWQTKRYPVRHWRRVVDALAGDLPVVLLGARGDIRTGRRIADGLGAGVIDLTGRTSVPELVAVIAESAGAVCCDSAAKFIAPAVGVDVVTLIGPTQPERTGPYRLGRAVVASVSCQGCLRRRCSSAVCMELIDPNDVIVAIRAMLAERT
ncbi:MAG: glycosyltransferase family 9 protein [Planctomycetota bacterium]